MAVQDETTSPPGAEQRRSRLAWWHNTPLYLRIVGALVLGLLTGLILGPQAAGLRLLSTVILQLLRARNRLDYGRGDPRPLE